MNKVFAVGVGPGSPKYVTDIVKDAISQCDVVIGYGYTIKTIEEYVKGKKILEVTMQNQEEAYQEIAKELKDVSDIYILGRGINYPIAIESALKLKELTYIHAEGIPGGEL